MPTSRLTTGADPLAVLISGGLDSAILLGDALGKYPAIYPLFIRCGLYWEAAELDHLGRFLSAIADRTLKPLTILELPVSDLYGDHWSLTGRDVPSAQHADEAVFLPGRNVLLLAKALLWCHLRHVPAVALGSLASNPFPDATSEFFSALKNVVNQAVHGNVQIRIPFAGMKKRDVMLLGQAFPLAYTLSCIAPEGVVHCGRCNKCAERRLAFEEAGLTDPTVYAGDDIKL